MVGTHYRGQGGIATVISGYIEQNLLDDMNFILISTHSSYDKSNFVAIFRFMLSIFMILFYGLYYSLGIVHVHMASRGSYFRKSIVVKISSLLGAKIVIHLHGAEFEDFYNKECSARKKAQISSTFNKADKVIVLSSQWFHWLEKIIEDKRKITVVHNSVRSLDLPERETKKNVILFLGRLGKRKGLNDLINAFSKVLVHCPFAELHIGGDGDTEEFKKQVKNLSIQNNVRFLGWIGGGGKAKCFANSDVYCLPSYNEGFPMGVLEAMSNNVAIVASNVGGIPDAITNNVDGLLVDAGDVNGLANALITLLTNETLRHQYSKAAKLKFENHFSFEVMLPKLKDIYAELLGLKK